MRRLGVLAMVAVGVMGAEREGLAELMAAARAGAPALREMIPARIHLLKERGGAAVWGNEFLFAVEMAGTASVSVDRAPAVAMKRVAGSELWYLTMRLRVGVTHSYEFFSDGKALGLMYAYDVAGYNMDSYRRAGVGRGVMSERRTVASKIYEGMRAHYWVYASPGVEAGRASPVMIWQDGEGMVGAQDMVRMRLAIVVENLVERGLIPPMVHVLIAPGTRGGPMRSEQYTEISARYGRYVLEEILPEVEKSYKLRRDGYSRGIGGLSAGGVCAFTAGWQMPEEFSRVYSHVGAFTTRAQGAAAAGGHLYPFEVRRSERKNLRVWLSSGTYDYENDGGSFALQNIQLANSLKLRGYDFHFRFGAGMHSVGQAALDLPEMLVWLWRGWEEGKTREEYEMEEAERGRPLFRVEVVGREAW